MAAACSAVEALFANDSQCSSQAVACQDQTDLIAEHDSASDVSFSHLAAA